MIMTPRLRKFALTAHVSLSVGWLGAVAGFLALAVAGLASQEAAMVRGAYLAMELTGWFIIVPLALTSLPSGLVMSLGTPWGLFRYYWVVAKLLITVVATILLLVHMRPVAHLARVVAETTLVRGELAGLRVKLVADSGAALLALLVATTLSVYKPPGMTPYGLRIQYEQAGTDSNARVGSPIGTSRWIYVFGAMVILLVVLFVALHLAGGHGSHTR